MTKYKEPNFHILLSLINLIRHRSLALFFSRSILSFLQVFISLKLLNTTQILNQHRLLSDKTRERTEIAQ